MARSFQCHCVLGSATFLNTVFSEIKDCVLNPYTRSTFHILYSYQVHCVFQNFTVVTTVNVDFLLLWYPRSVQDQHVLSWFQAFVTKHLRSSLLWEITQRIVVIPCIFGLLTLEDRSDRFLETSAKNYYFTPRSFLEERRSQHDISLTFPNTSITLVPVFVLDFCFLLWYEYWTGLSVLVV
jgi:hypothetical protein